MICKYQFKLGRSDNDREIEFEVADGATPEEIAKAGREALREEVRLYVRSRVVRALQGKRFPPHQGGRMICTGRIKLNEED